MVIMVQRTVRGKADCTAISAHFMPNLSKFTQVDHDRGRASVSR